MTIDATITCPNCQTEIKLTESLAAPLIAATKREYEKKIADKDAALDKREAELRRQQDAVKDAQANVETLVAEKLKSERGVIAADEARKAKLQLGADLEVKAKEISELKDVLLQHITAKFAFGDRLQYVKREAVGQHGFELQLQNFSLQLLGALFRPAS